MVAVEHGCVLPACPTGPAVSLKHLSPDLYPPIRVLELCSISGFAQVLLQVVASQTSCAVELDRDTAVNAGWTRRSDSLSTARLTVPGRASSRQRFSAGSAWRDRDLLENARALPTSVPVPTLWNPAVDAILLSPEITHAASPQSETEVWTTRCVMSLGERKGMWFLSGAWSTLQRGGRRDQRRMGHRHLSCSKYPRPEKR